MDMFRIHRVNAHSASGTIQKEYRASSLYMWMVTVRVMCCPGLIEQVQFYWQKMATQLNSFLEKHIIEKDHQSMCTTRPMNSAGDCVGRIYKRIFKTQS